MECVTNSGWKFCKGREERRRPEKLGKVKLGRAAKKTEGEEGRGRVCFGKRLRLELLGGGEVELKGMNKQNICNTRTKYFFLILVHFVRVNLN